MVCITALAICVSAPVPIAAQPGVPSSLALRLEPEALQVRTGGDVSLRVFVRNTSTNRLQIPSIDSSLRVGAIFPYWHSPLFVEIETPESEGWTQVVFTEKTNTAPSRPQPRTIELLPGEERLLGAITLTDEKLEVDRVTTTVSYVHPGATIRARARFVNDSPTLNGREVWAGEVSSASFTVTAPAGSIPGVRLAASLQPEQREYAIGEPVFVLAEIANVGTVPVAFPDGVSPNGVPEWYSFTAVDVQNRAVPGNSQSPVPGGLRVVRTLKPGEVVSERIMLNQWCRFERPGTYTVRVARVFKLRPPLPPDRVVSSPTIEWPLEQQFEIAFVDDPRALREAENRLISALDLSTLALLWQPPLESRFIERLRGPLESDEASNVLVALNRMGRRPYVSGVLALLHNDRNQAGISAALQAVWVDDVTEAVPWVRRLLNSPVPEIRKTSADALASLGPKARLTSLEIRPAAGQRGNPVPQSRIAQDVRFLDSLETRERSQAAERLGALGPAAQSAIPKLRKILEDPFPQARIAAAVALARIGDAPEPSLDALMPMLKGMDSTSRDAGAAVAAFGRGAEPRLRQALQSRELGVPRRAVEALGLSGAREEASVRALGDALGDGDPDIRLHAVVALGRVGARAARYAPQVALALGQTSKPGRVLALEALGRLGDRSTTPRVRALLKDDDPLVREYAAAALKRLDGAATGRGSAPPQ